MFEKNHKKKKVLLITRNLPPLIGGMERLNWHMLKELTKTYDTKAIGPNHSTKQIPPPIRFYPATASTVWQFLISSLVLTLRLAREWKPDYIIAGSGLTAPAAWIAARASGAKSIVYLHGLDITVDNFFYRNLWIPLIKKMDRVVTNSNATAGLAENYGICRSKIGIVHPGVEIPGKIDPERALKFRRKYNLEKRKILLSLGRLTERKGIREFVELSLPQIVRRCPDILLVIIGGEAKDSLAAKTQTKNSILEAADKAGVKNNVKFIGWVTDRDEISAAFNSSEIHVFPIRKIPNDPEGFGMVAIEAAAHGVPTVAFSTGGVTDAIGNNKSGWLVKSGDYSNFAEKVSSFLDLKNKKPLKEGSLTFAQRKTWLHFGEGIHHELNKISSKHNAK
ncbi:glycosyltransferase family 4 protein [Microbulbifer echini]|uniref:Glycosyltransferase family 4 protein n=1 Tax=Microbulbifer echini TaxID=1529067 RepID=A0ABV4NM41_9GAMM